jgi:PadR family transcriptional regulator PadR
MRRRPGTLLPLEAAILEAALRMRQAGDLRFHGFGIAKIMADDAGTLTAHGTLYKALGRLEAAGLLEGRPRRRMYTVTGAAQLALAQHRQDSWRAAPIGRAAWETP